jgi:hypothetical protein
MTLKALLILFLLIFASAITIALVNANIVPKNIKTMLPAPKFSEIVPLGETIDTPIAPS